MGKVLAVYHQKGGVGKTTTAVNLTAAMRLRGRKTLLCDIDPQGNATSGMGVDKSLRPNVYDVLLGDVDAGDAVVKTESGDVLPANSSLSGAAVELVSAERRELILKDALSKLRDSYDYIFIDCPPQFGLLSLNALCASDSIIVPFQCEYYALEGLGDLLVELRAINKNLNPALYIEGVVLTMYDGRTKLTQQITREIEEYFGKKLFKTQIPRNIRLTEAPSHGMDIFRYDKRSKGAKAYLSLAEELLKSQKKRGLEIGR
ncbi:MAG: ParA family protein [Clostridiales bacterium]|jgi:chromosome partitioning protein|nr:ParA family protein [Clostridiales bacterium]